MYYPSIDLNQDGMQAAIEAGSLSLQTGQWVHDLISKGRIINTAEGVLIVWHSPQDTFKSYNERFNRLAKQFRNYITFHKPFTNEPEQLRLWKSYQAAIKPKHQQLQEFCRKKNIRQMSPAFIKSVLKREGYAFNHGLHAGSTQESEYQSAQNLFGTILGRGRQHQERTTHSNLIN